MGDYKIEIICSHCGEKSKKSASSVNRANREGRPIYCNRICFGLTRRLGKTKDQLIEEKKLYDIEYRKRPNHKQKKAESFQRIYDPEKAAVKRKERAPYHLEYCRQPEYKSKKKKYDRVNRAKKDYGDFWEIQILSLEIKEEVSSRMSNYQIKLESETLNKKQRRTRHERSNGKKLEVSTMGNP